LKIFISKLLPTSLWNWGAIAFAILRFTDLDW
jgi:hypothetical protein